MTSKRMGIVLVALFALWSLAGTGPFVTSSNTPGDSWLGASLVFAGDPDDYTNSQSSSPDNGDPDDYTDPGPQDEEETQSDSAPDEDDEDTVKTLLEIALATLVGLGDVIK